MTKPARAGDGARPEQREISRLRAQLRRAKAQIADLEARADTDALLGLTNRRGFERDLKRAIAFVTRYRVEAAVVFLDVDRLKPVNDAFGHAAGDALLKEVAAALTRSVRASDIVARLGGDEFGVLMWNLGEADAAKRSLVLEHAIDALALTFDGQTLPAAASAGFVMLGANNTVEDVLGRADRAMYARKAVRKTIHEAAQKPTGRRVRQ